MGTVFLTFNLGDDGADFQELCCGGGHEVWFTYSLNIPIGEPVLLCNMDHLIARNSFR